VNDWVCDSCETNNYAQDSKCRICARPPGSVTGEVKAVARPRDWTPQARTPVKFTQSKYTALERPQLTLAPTAPVKPTPPPKPPTPSKPPPPPKPVYVPPTYTPPRRRRRGGIGVGKVLLWLFLGGVGLAFVRDLVGSVDLSSPSTSSSDSGSTSGTACPTAVAKWLPASATLIAQYETDEHQVTLCQESSSGQVWYDGQVKGAAVNQNTHISLRATRTSNGYTAVNKNYVYEVTGTQLVVTISGKRQPAKHLTKVAG
jgi:hypothetical protein